MKALFTEARRATLREATSNQAQHFKAVLTMTEKEFAANPPPGFSYNPNAPWIAHRKSHSHTVLGPRFFKANRQMRTHLLYHEIGHDLMRNFEQDWADLLEPHRLDTSGKRSAHSRYDNPYGMEQRPEEMVADIYASLFTGGEHWFEGEKYKALFRQARKLAVKYGLPVPD